jgi:hypothetical protein
LKILHVAGKIKKTCKFKNLQVLKAFQKILAGFANFEKFVSNHLCGLARTIFELLYRRFVNIGAAFSVNTVTF